MRWRCKGVWKGIFQGAFWICQCEFHGKCLVLVAWEVNLVVFFKFRMSLKFRVDVTLRQDSLRNLLSMGYPTHQTAMSTYRLKTS